MLQANNVQFNWAKGSALLRDIEIETEYEEDRSLDQSAIYAKQYSVRMSLARFLDSVPGLYDPRVYEGIYNLNYRGINTSPVNGRMPIGMSQSGFFFQKASRTPDLPDLLTYVKHYNGIGYFDYGEWITDQPKHRSIGLVDFTDKDDYLIPSVDFIIGMQTDLNAKDLNVDASFSIRGPIASDSFSNGSLFYGINASFEYQKGRYQNPGDATAKSDYWSNFDYRNEGYLDGYLKWKSNTSSTVVDVSYFFNHRDAGPYSGYWLFTEDFDKPILDEDEVAKQRASNINSYNKLSQAGLGIDLKHYFDYMAFSLGAFYWADSKRSLRDATGSTIDVPDVGLSGVFMNNVGYQTLNSYLLIEPLSSKTNSSGFSLGMNFWAEEAASKEAGYDWDFDFTPGGHPIEDSLTMDYGYKNLDMRADVFAYYNLDFFSKTGLLPRKSNVSLGLRGSYLHTSFDQKGSLKDNGYALGWLNSRLASIGLPIYDADFDYSFSYNEFAVLPEASFQYQWNSEDKLGDFVGMYINYYMSANPGGINPYMVRLADQSNRMYALEEVHTTELGILSRFDSSQASMRLVGFYNYILDSHYVSAHNGLDPYYGNIPSAFSSGVDWVYRHRAASRLEFDFFANYTYSTYLDFVDEYFTAPGNEDSVDYSGNRIINSPLYSFRAGMTYQTKNGFFFRVENDYIGPHFYDYGNTLENKGYNLLRLHIGWEDDLYAVEIFADNLLNAEYTEGAVYTAANPSGSMMDRLFGNDFTWKNSALRTIGAPVVFGINFGVRF